MPRTRICGIRLVAIALVAMAVLVTEAAAQVSPFRRAGLNLTKEDFALLEAAGAKLYAKETPKVGAAESWANEESKNSGTVILVAAYTWNNMPCRRMTHQIMAAGRKDPHSVQIDRCRTPSGDWKVRY